ncbi:MAG: SRPBCC domain-containing protein [Nocardioides sp.]
MTATPHVHEVTVGCDPATAFEAWTARGGAWWPGAYTADERTFEGITVEPHVGGRVVEHHDDGRSFQWGEVTVWEPGAHLAHSFVLAHAGDPSAVDVRFTAVDGGTLVHLEHGGWHEGNIQDRAKFGDWHVILASYAALVQAG